MKIRSFRTLQVLFNVLILLFAVATFRLMSGRIATIFSENDAVTNQQKVALFARSIRHSVLVGDLVSIRSVLQDSLKDPSVRMVRYLPQGGSEGICVDSDGSCYDSETGSQGTVSSQLDFDNGAKARADSSMQVVGSVQARFENVSAREMNRSISIYLGIALCLLVIFFNVVLLVFFGQIHRQIRWGINAVKTLSRGGSVNVERSLFVERQQFQTALTDLNAVLEEYRESVAVASKREGFMQFAQDVGHNVLSPLTAAYAEAQALPGVPEENRMRVMKPLRVVIDTVRDLQRRSKETRVEKEPSSTLHPVSDGVRNELLAGIIESTVAEKRSEFGSLSGAGPDLVGSVGEAGYGLSAKINHSIFSQILSNLVNNSVEAGAKNIVIELGERDGAVSIRVKDDGAGISTDVLPLLGVRGASFGKPTGLGIGLSHAKQHIEAWGGRLAITSTLGKGTSIEMSLPVSTPPRWFPEKIALPPSAWVVIVDDSPLVHETWKYRFTNLRTELSRPILIHFENVSDAEAWFRENSGKSRQEGSIYLVDYDLGAKSKNGLDFIAGLGIERRAVLVTGRSDDPRVLSRCLEMGVKLLPKELAAAIPIEMIYV